MMMGYSQIAFFHFVTHCALKIKMTMIQRGELTNRSVVNPKINRKTNEWLSFFHLLLQIQILGKRKSCHVFILDAFDGDAPFVILLLWQKWKYFAKKPFWTVIMNFYSGERPIQHFHKYNIYWSLKSFLKLFLWLVSSSADSAPLLRCVLSILLFITHFAFTSIFIIYLGWS